VTVELVHRPARTSRPLDPPAPETVAAPPVAGDRAARGLPLQALLPVAGALTSGVMIVVFRSGNRAFLLVAALLLVVALAGGLVVAVGQRGGPARERRAQRESYLDYLESLRARMRARGRDLRTSALLLDPAPEALLELVRDPARMWERRPGHADFLAVRVGIGDETRLPLVVPPEQDPVHPYDPILHAEAVGTARQCAVVRGIPVTVRLDGAGPVALIGERAEVLATARSLLLQLASLHAPEDLVLAAAFPASAAADWYGTDLLPHLTDPDPSTGPGLVRRVAASVADLAVLLGPDLAERSRQVALGRRGRPGPDGPRTRLVIVADDHGQVASSLPLPEPGVSLADLGVTVVHLLGDRLHEPSDVTVRITLDRGVATVEDSRLAGAAHAVADRTSGPLFEAVARTVSGRRLSLTGPDAPEAGPAGADLLGLGDPDRLTPATAWRARSPRDFLRVPIGVDDLGAPVLLDLKEAARLGMGPHGLCVGATGSGKSELLRTLILSLTATHPPEDLSLVLVDYKGGAAFAPFAPLPHVAGIIDNLAEDTQLTERARASINGEVVRRQELLKAAGSVPSVGHYRELRRTRPELPALPHLLVVIDEFGELLTADPDFVDLLLTIGRIGRSIGVHLLLSSQRIEPGKLRGLETYLSYRIGLRTFSEAESSTILETKDAFHLPPVPGYGYLKVDTTVYRRFRSGYVSGPLPEDRAADPEPAPRPVLPLPVHDRREEPGQPAAEEPAEPVVDRTVLATCVERLHRPDRQVPPVWLPPLPDRLALPARPPGTPGLRIPLGLVDDPAQQRQDAWSVDLARGGGHLAVIGAPQSGRSTLLRTLAVSAALTHTPRELSIYGMDLSGGGLRALAGFPQVGGVATRGQPDRLQRVLEELLGMLATRERVFAERGIDSLAMLRAEHAAGRIPELVAPDVLLLVDGAGQLRTDFESLEEPLLQLLRSGSSFGLHVVLALTRWNDLRMAHQPLIGTRLELRLNDPVDSVVDRKLAGLIRPGQPGRVLTEDRRYAQVALPAVRLVEPAATGEAIRAAADAVLARWTGPVAPPVRSLPLRLRSGEVPAIPAAPPAVALGLRQDTMGAACLELDGRDQHLVVLGDAGAGKTTVLSTVVRGLVERMSPAEVVFAVLDLRGRLAPAVPAPYLGAHATNATLGRGLAESVAVELGRRSTDRSAGTTARHIVVLVDDYDVIGAGDRDLLRPLLPYLPSARDLGLHVLLARPVAGAARALYDPVLQALRDTGGSVLLMSGDAGEGQLLPRTYAQPLPPGRGRLLRRGDPSCLIQVASP
jgi:DNA segregation ATPase FtsK/SpoIIIE, S-DNA-T family